MQRFCDKNPIINIYLVSYGFSWQTVWIQISYAANVMLHGLVDMIVACYHMLKIARDENFYLLLEKTTGI